MNQIKNERRKINRFLSRGQAFALLRGRHPIVGRIRDISPSGLSFQYLTDFLAEEDSEEDSEEAEVSIFREHFHLNNISCTVVYDITDYTFLDFRITKKRCGIKFIRVTPSQFSRIRYFMSLYAKKRPTCLHFLQKTDYIF
ncbi:hypothetical protein DENIS_2074 [Desulfonema ishimotonii]|uniref:PilZ domain-containing protein n=2 Tax=Desulfonema ishimotonii TaxID=45657 RepID=A0A401FVZ6_9BACT|nr:hypothetical protein DENIS_2074 [Desulfonema ishimotonii]